MAGLLQILMWNAVEAAMLAAIVAAVARAAKLRAPVRHVLWLTVLLKLVIPPIALHSFGLSGICATGVKHVRDLAVRWPKRNEFATSKPVVEPESVDDLLSQALTEFEELAAARIADGEAELADARTGEQSGTLEPSDGVETETTPAVPPGIVMSVWNSVLSTGLPRNVFYFWVASSLVVFAVRARQFAALLRLVRRAEPASASVETACRDLANRLGLRGAPAVRIVERSLSPTVCALGRTTILLPAELVNRCNNRVVRSVLAHELAHVKRRDHWWCWIELTGSCVYWWHPVFWWSRHEMRRAADEAADAWAVSVLGCRRQYAESLLQTVELLVADRAVAAAWCPALGQRDTIARRLTMIMKEPLSRRLSWPTWLTIAVVGLLVLPAAPLRSSAQDPPKPPASVPGGVPSEDEIAAAVEAFDAAVSQRPREPRADEPPSRDRRPDEPRPPEAGRRDAQHQPGGGDRRPDAPRTDPGPRESQRAGTPASPGGRGEGPRDPERRLQELEAKLDRIMQMLESRAGQTGGGGMPGMPGMPSGAVPLPPGGQAGFAPSGGDRMGPGGGMGMGPGGMSMGMGAGGFSGGRFGSARGGPDAVEDMLRGIELGPDQRERIEKAMHDVQAEMQKIEAEQQRVIQDFQRRRMELERRRAEIIQEVLSPEQRERMQQRGPGGDRSRERGGDGRGEMRGSGRGTGSGAGRGDGGGQGRDEPRAGDRGGPERPRDAEPRREGARGRGEPGPDRPREATEPRRGPEGERPREGGDAPRRRESDRPEEGAGLNAETFGFFVGLFR